MLLHLILTTWDGLKDFSGKADVAVVLGNKVNEDGTLSNRLKARLDGALELYNEDKIREIVVSGGFGKEGFDEAIKMKEYLVKNKVIETNVLVDSKGNTTGLTATNFLKFQKHKKYKKVVVVSQFYHVSRTKLIFRRALASEKETCEVYGYAPNYFEFRDVYSITREFVAFYYYWLFK